jgi:hypothetical protein
MTTTTNDPKEVSFKFSDGGKCGSGFTNETRDCTVRAVAIACEVPYAEAHAELKQRGRKDGRGFSFATSVKHDPVLCGQRLVSVYDWMEKNGKCICLCTAQKRFPRGRFIVRKSGHVFAMIDGEVRDTSHNSKWIMVRNLWRVEANHRHE